jgi:hypothetical protein
MCKSGTVNPPFYWLALFKTMKKYAKGCADNAVLGLFNSCSKKYQINSNFFLSKKETIY